MLIEIPQKIKEDKKIMKDKPPRPTHKSNKLLILDNITDI